MAVKKKKATRKKVTVKKKTTVKKAAVKKKAATRKKAVSKKKTATRLLDDNVLAPVDSDVNESLLLHDPLATIAGDEQTSLLANDPFAMINEGGEETERHFGFRTESPVEHSATMYSVETTDEVVVEPETDPEPDPEPESLNEVNQMDDETTKSTSQPVIDLGSDLTISDVEAKKIELVHILADALPVKLNAEELEHIDGAGLQLLAALFKNAAKNNLEISWEKVSASFMDAVKLVGLVELLKLQDVDVNDDGEGSAWGLF